MLGAECVGAAQVDQPRALAHGGGRLPGVECGHAGVAGRKAEHDRSLLIDPLHLFEVRRGLGQVGQHGGDERLSRAVLKRGVESALLSDRRVRLGADAGTAQRSRAVPRMHFDRVVQRQQLPEQRVVQLAGEPPHLLFAEQIGTADGADKERVAGEHADRLARLARDDGDVFRRVAWSMKALELQVAEGQPLAVTNLAVVEAQRGAGAGDRPRPVSASSRAPETKSA